MSEPAVWYRVEDGRYSGANEFDEPYDAGPWVHCREIEVLRETPKGVWIPGGRVGPQRFVLRDARKRYACPTEAEAWESWRARKARQARILRAQLAHVEEALRLAFPEPEP